MRISKKWCLKQCRFYRGENECPAILQKQGGAWVWAWHCEMLWVQEMIEKGFIPTAYSESYVTAGLSDFERDDGVHLDLKEFLYGYNLHRSEGTLTSEEFKHWYIYDYLAKGDYYKEGHLK